MALNYPNNPVDGDTWTDGNGIEWEFKGYGWKEIKVPTLLSMSDVSGVTLNIGDRLKWDGTNWSPVDTGSLSLTDLTDIQGTPVKDDYLVHDGTNFQMASSNADPVVFGKMETSNGRSISGYTSNLVWFYMDYDKVIYDTHGMFDLDTDPTRLTIPVAGIYRVNSTCLTRTVFNSLTTIRMELNLKPYSVSDVLQANYYDRCDQGRYYINGYVVNRWSIVRRFDVGDYIKTYLRGTASSNIDYRGATNVSMSALKLADLP
ncbi:hypothetical protein GQ473_00050 [archaeon]|nr:hypothetical protein [archaeon]